MRRFALSSLVVLSVVALAACATSPDDVDLGLTSDTQHTEPEEGTTSAKLPPPTNTTPDEPAEEKDAGATKDAGSSNNNNNTADSGGGAPTAVDCDLNDPLKLIVWQLELASQSSPVPCPCGSGQCCYMGQTCLSNL
jgi:hypothetical protein